MSPWALTYDIQLFARTISLSVLNDTTTTVESFPVCGLLVTWHLPEASFQLYILESRPIEVFVIRAEE